MQKDSNSLAAVGSVRACASSENCLEHLDNRYARRFANHWEFVRFARERGLDLDFTTPPKRPARP
jgi:hypothetical protein